MPVDGGNLDRLPVPLYPTRPPPESWTTGPPSIPWSHAPPGVRHQRVTEALASAMTVEVAGSIARQLVADLLAPGTSIRNRIELLKFALDRVEGTAIQRAEVGVPGSYDALESLAGLSTEELRAALRIATVEVGARVGQGDSE